MAHIVIRRPLEGGRQALHTFFRTVIEDTFVKEGIAHLTDDLEDEIESKKQYLNSDFESSGEGRYFLLAVDSVSSSIIGTIEVGVASELICRCTKEELTDLLEIGTVFVHPDNQGQGVGRLLVSTMIQRLRKKGIEEFCLDCGYTKSQSVWKKMFGEPDYFLEDYWGIGSHHMIWRRRTKEEDYFEQR